MPVSEIAVGMGGVLWMTDNSSSAVSNPNAIRLSPNRPPCARWRSSAASMSSTVTKPRPTSNPPKLMTNLDSRSHLLRSRKYRLCSLTKTQLWLPDAAASTTEVVQRAGEPGAEN
jgi:hypothetical protein